MICNTYHRVNWSMNTEVVEVADSHVRRSHAEAKEDLHLHRYRNKDMMIESTETAMTRWIYGRELTFRIHRTASERADLSKSSDDASRALVQQRFSLLSSNSMYSSSVSSMSVSSHNTSSSLREAMQPESAMFEVRVVWWVREGKCLECCSWALELLQKGLYLVHNLSWTRKLWT